MASVRGWITVKAEDEEGAESAAIAKFVAQHDIDDGIDEIEITALPDET